MLRKLLVPVLVLTTSTVASAGPLRESAERAGRELAAQNAAASRGRGRTWTGIALLGGGGTLAIFGALERREDGNEGDDADDTPGAKDSNAWEHVMLGGGIAAAALGGFLLATGRRGASPSITMRGGRLAIAQTLRF